MYNVKYPPSNVNYSSMIIMLSEYFLMFYYVNYLSVTNYAYDSKVTPLYLVKVPLCWNG